MVVLSPVQTDQLFPAHSLTLLQQNLSSSFGDILLNNRETNKHMALNTKPSQRSISITISISRHRHWYAARLCFGSASGLLRLEELVRRFLISRETLSIRMLDDNLDPTPLLKEIRDDKVATIIIDANASVSYLILKKVSSQTSIHSLGPPIRVGYEVTLTCTVRTVVLVQYMQIPWGTPLGFCCLVF